LGIISLTNENVIKRGALAILADAPVVPTILGMVCSKYHPRNHYIIEYFGSFARKLGLVCQVYNSVLFLFVG
jgi:hypothetical protein